jgi:hypothetical protein
MSNTSLIRAVQAANSRLAWSSLSLLLEALETEAEAVGADDGYNLSLRRWRAVSAPTNGNWGMPAPIQIGGETLIIKLEGQNSWVILGGCGYGSSVACSPLGFRVESCGGHWVQWEKFGGWSCDAKPSIASWGDSPEEGRDHRTEAEIVSQRIESLKKLEVSE